MSDEKISKFKLRVKKIIKFRELWDNYPKEAIKHINPKTNEDVIDNHCAVNLSESFYKCGITLKSFLGVKCSRWVCPHKKSVHILRAQEFATWLKTRPFPGCPKYKKCTGDNFKTELNNKQGIIFFKDYWQRESEKGGKNRTGDHIDLWNDRTLAGSGLIESMARISIGLHWDGLFSDHSLSKEVLFWEIN